MNSAKKEDQNIVPHVLIIGAGSTGSATAHDLALRGLRVTVLERGEVAFGTTGRNHCLLHSGGRYCVTDQESAIECIEENMILRRIMPDLLELNDGLFVAITEADLAFKDRFLQGCVEPQRIVAIPDVGYARNARQFLHPVNSNSAGTARRMMACTAEREASIVNRPDAL